MGSLNLQEMIDHAPSDVALAWHLRHNLYPPPSLGYASIPYARLAIELCATGRGDTVLEIDGRQLIDTRSGTQQPVTAENVVDGWRLDAFVAALRAEEKEEP